MKVQLAEAIQRADDPTKHARPNLVLHLRDLQAPLLLTTSSRLRRRRLGRRRHHAPGLTRPAAQPSILQLYGPEYLRLTAGAVIEELEPPVDPEDWAYGSLVLADGGRSEPGWYPPAHAQCTVRPR